MTADMVRCESGLRCWNGWYGVRLSSGRRSETSIQSGVVVLGEEQNEPVFPAAQQRERDDGGAALPARAGGRRTRGPNTACPSPLLNHRLR